MSWNINILIAIVQKVNSYHKRIGSVYKKFIEMMGMCVCYHCFVEKCNRKKKMQHQKEEKGNKKRKPCLAVKRTGLLQ